MGTEVNEGNKEECFEYFFKLYSFDLILRFLRYLLFKFVFVVSGRHLRAIQASAFSCLFLPILIIL